ncbi:class I adenylate-forming enzyme family protein [Mucisphaera sp.]|uniref:class I adenylate-forming enzyme family protein n=1 Tax=Mucisphaera sp. TaxID=2913024 RepID=UPI003D0DF770
MTPLWTILNNCRKHPKRVAMVDDLRTYTYGRLGVGSLIMAGAIRRLTDRQRVGVMLPTSGAFPLVLLGSWLAGRVPVPINYLLSKSDLAHVANDADIDTIITVEKMLDFVGGPEAIPPGVKLVFLEQLNLKSLPELRWPRLPKSEDDAVLLYTSGTSGKPKGVRLTHGNIAANIQSIAEHAKDIDYGTFLGVLPQFHSFGMTALTLWPLSRGRKAVFTARFVPKKITELIQEHDVSVFVAVPSMYGALMSVKGATADTMKSLRFSISGGEPLSADLANRYCERFKIPMYEGYGLTETSPVTNCCIPGQTKPGSVGRAIPGVRNLIVDDNLNLLGPNEDGEILIVGPNVMAGYHHLPDLTAEVIISLTLPTGETVRAFRTGDIGHLDDEGYLFITGRKKEMLIISGENVFPREIEEVLNTHPSVHASAVIGVRDPNRGELPMAFVEIEEGHDFDEQALKTHCREHMAPFKVPRDIRKLDALPRNPTGKILRRELKPD